MSREAMKAWILSRLAEDPNGCSGGHGVVVSIENQLPDGCTWGDACATVLEMQRSGLIRVLSTVRTYSSDGKPMNFFLTLA
jgi:hypothetical protein